MSLEMNLKCCLLPWRRQLLPETSTDGFPETLRDPVIQRVHADIHTRGEAAMSIQEEKVSSATTAAKLTPACNDISLTCNATFAQIRENYVLAARSE